MEKVILLKLLFCQERWLNHSVETMGTTDRKPFNAWMSWVAVPALKILKIPQV